MEKSFKLKKFYLKKSLNLRKNFIKLLINGYKYHIGATLSCIDIMTVLAYEKKIDIFNKKNIFILSKGHALAAIFLILFDKKILNMNKFKKLNLSQKIGNQLDIYNLKNIHWSTGSLGHSIGVGIGLAIAYPKKKIWIMLGDAEVDEGSIWEGFFYIIENKLENICIIIDKNNISASKFIYNPVWYKKKVLKNLGFNYYEVDGHSFIKLSNILTKINNTKNSSILVAKTIKGKGIKYFENNIKFNHSIPSKPILEKILKNIEKNK